MVAQASGRSDDDVATVLQGALLAANVHPADAGDHAGSGGAIEPDELTVDLESEFAGRRDHQTERLQGRTEAFGVSQQGRCKGEAVGDGLARTGLRRHEKVPILHIGLKHCGLDGRGVVVASVGEGTFEADVCFGKGHVFAAEPFSGEPSGLR
jgi:hypothetical protein